MLMDTYCLHPIGKCKSREGELRPKEFGGSGPANVTIAVTKSLVV